MRGGQKLPATSPRQGRFFPLTCSAYAMCRASSSSDLEFPKSSHFGFKFRLRARFRASGVCFFWPGLWHWGAIVWHSFQAQHWHSHKHICTRFSHSYSYRPPPTGRQWSRSEAPKATAVATANNDALHRMLSWAHQRWSREWADGWARYL